MIKSCFIKSRYYNKFARKIIIVIKKMCCQVKTFKSFVHLSMSMCFTEPISFANNWIDRKRPSVIGRNEGRRLCPTKMCLNRQNRWECVQEKLIGCPQNSQTMSINTLSQNPQSALPVLGVNFQRCKTVTCSNVRIILHPYVFDNRSHFCLNNI